MANQANNPASDENEQSVKQDLDQRSLEELDSALMLAQHTVCKQYLNELSYYPIVEPNPELMDETTEKCIRTFRLTQLTCKKGEDIFQKLSTVYHAAMSLGCSLFVMVNARSNAPAKFYLGIRGSERIEDRNVSFKALRDGLVSNFPGTQIEEVPPSKGLQEKVEEIFGKDVACISSVSCVAALRGKEKTENKGFVQGLEKLVDVMRGTPYTALFIADPVSAQQQREIQSGYEELYSTLSSFRKSTWSYNANESKSVTESLSHGITESITNGTSHIQSHTISQTKGTSNTVGIGITFGGNQSKTDSESTTESENNSTEKINKGDDKSTKEHKKGKNKKANAARVGSILSSVGQAVTLIPAVGPVIGPIISGVGGGLQSGSISKSVTKGIAKSFGLSGSLSGNYAHTSSQSQTEGNTQSDSTSESNTRGETDTTTEGKTDTASTGRTLQIENVNKSVEELLKRIEEQLKRGRESEDYGAYSCGAYFLSSRPEASLLAANTYRALMVGEGSSVESGAVNLWSDNTVVAQMKEYLKRFAQPVFAVPLTESAETCMLYSPSTIVSGLELPLHLGLPTKSVVGLPIIDHAEFGRNSNATEKALPLGRLYHMGQIERGASVQLDIGTLTAHTFITGSTGAGKSNTIYKILQELCYQATNPAKFLVIEPAKGEYKDALGGYEGVSVYGTNPKKAPLLRLNPFSFPDDIHVLEHIDRLVEVFNACWPMYAAMPAVLKDAIEASYVSCGWSLTRSTCAPKRFPTFATVLKKLPEIMDSSAYSSDTKGDYTGALVTRVKSLTNGINGLIFCSDDEIPDAKMFDENVIVDLSRAGSMETKALLMGILMIKLQEYRMAEAKGSNAELRHVTVLEEAHNLLRRTSAVQSQESSNLQGKSVEMLANAIAEMRTYGEGFIIADQAPGLLDMAVIRNTNTKIIMRLPDESDRELVGKAAGLNDDQIVELARLDVGVAAVFQNHWLEPVLCKVEKFSDEKAYSYELPKQTYDPDTEALFTKIAHGVKDGAELSDECVDRLKLWIDRLDTGRVAKELLWKALEPQNSFPEEDRLFLLYCLVDGKPLLEQAEQFADPVAARAFVDQTVMDALHVSSELAEELRTLIFRYAARRVEHDVARSNDLLYYGGVQ